MYGTYVYIIMLYTHDTARARYSRSCKTQCCFDGGPQATTVAHHQNNIGDT